MSTNKAEAYTLQDELREAEATMTVQEQEEAQDKLWEFLETLGTEEEFDKFHRGEL